MKPVKTAFPDAGDYDTVSFGFTALRRVSGDRECL